MVPLNLDFDLEMQVVMLPVDTQQRVVMFLTQVMQMSHHSQVDL